jgi:hypothetical protein
MSSTGNEMCAVRAIAEYSTTFEKDRTSGHTPFARTKFNLKTGASKVSRAIR